MSCDITVHIFHCELLEMWVGGGCGGGGDGVGGWGVFWFQNIASKNVRFQNQRAKKSPKSNFINIMPLN